MKEKSQRQKRYRLALPLWIRIRQRGARKTDVKEETEVVEETITDNISSTGCYFQLSQKPPVGSVAEMEIVIPHQYAGAHSGRLRCRGKIVRAEEQAGSKKVGVACTIESYDFYSAKAAGD